MNAFFEPGVFSGGFFKAGSGTAPPGPSLANLDPTVDSGTAAKVQLVFGFDKHFHSYTGNTVRLVRSSDSAQSDFGLTASGRFDKDAVNAWRSGSDVSLVKFYDQGGTAKELLAKSGGSASSLPVVVSNTWICAGTSFNTTTGALTLSSTDGAPMCEITGGKYLELTSSGLDMASGMEVHMLTATKLRKIEANNTTDPLTNDSTAETYFSYGLSTTNNLRHDISGGNYLYLLRRIGTGAGGTDQTLSTGGQLKANSVNIVSCVCDTNIRLYARGRMPINAATSAGNQIANAVTSNGTFRIGRRYPGASGESTSAGNFYFSGVIVTDSLTDFERFKIQARMEQVANQHLAYDLTVLDDMLGANGDIVDWRDINMGTGQVAGKKGNVTFQINLATTISATTPSWTEDEACPYWGVQGLRANGRTRYANGFIATTNYFMARTSGTIGSMHFRIDATNNPAQVIASGSNTTIAGLKGQGLNDDFHVGLGDHHNQPNFYGKVYETLDTTGKTNGGVNGGWGDQSLSQQTWKYMFNTAHGDIGTAESDAITLSTAVVGETQTWPIGTDVTWANAFTDLGIYPSTPESRTYKNWEKSYHAYNDHLIFQVATFEPGGYNPASPVVADMRKANLKSYAISAVGTGGTGNQDFSYASKDGWGSAVHGNTSGRLQSMSYGDVFDGVRMLNWFSEEVWTETDVKKFKTNIYKIYTEGWPA